jgi:hypothetical protein
MDTLPADQVVGILTNMLAKTAIRGNFMSAQQDIIAQGDKAVQTETFAEQLSQLASNLGDVNAGRFLALSAGSEPTDSDASGAFMSADGETFGSDTYNIGGVNSGVLQFGLSSTTGKAYAGGGEVILDANGISMVMPTTTYSTGAAIKWADGTETPIKIQARKYAQGGGGIDTNALLIGATGNATVSFAVVNLVSTNGDATATSSISIEAGNGAGTGLVTVSGDVFQSYATQNLINGSNIVTEATVYSGTYTPTLSNTTNIAASTAYVCQYMRVGSVVTVSGHVDIDATAAGNMVLGITIPIASNFASTDGLAGAAAAIAVNESAGILADASNNRATLRTTAVSTANNAWFFTFTYLII